MESPALEGTPGSLKRDGLLYQYQLLRLHKTSCLYPIEIDAGCKTRSIECSIVKTGLLFRVDEFTYFLPECVEDSRALRVNESVLHS